MIYFKCSLTKVTCVCSFSTVQSLCTITFPFPSSHLQTSPEFTGILTWHFLAFFFSLGLLSCTFFLILLMPYLFNHFLFSFLHFSIPPLHFFWDLELCSSGCPCTLLFLCGPASWGWCHTPPYWGSNCFSFITWDHSLILIFQFLILQVFRFFSSSSSYNLSEH